MDTQNTKPEFNPDLFKITVGMHRNKNVIWLKFDYDKSLKDMLQQATKAYWSASQKSWYIADNNFHRSLCGLKPNSVGKEVLSKIGVVNLPEFQKYQKHSYTQRFVAQHGSNLFY